MNLQTLDLQRNDISGPSSVSRMSFKPLKKLKYFYLARNQIDQVGFELPVKIQMIDLSLNGINTISQLTFKKCKNLEQLFIHTNKYATYMIYMYPIL